MRLGIISDIEGNDQKFRTVLEELQDCAFIVCLGDSVGDKGDSNKVIELLNNKRTKSILGNHDLEIILGKDIAPSEYMAKFLAESPSEFHTDITLTDENMEFLRGLRYVLKIRHEGRQYGFYHALHGKVDDEIYFEYVNEGNAYILFEKSGSTVTFIGHKHIPALFLKNNSDQIRYARFRSTKTLPIEPANQYIINVGSVGAPRDKEID
ncbi:metallophosphoesterase family protein, partial [Thermodesulfobacteriota bacterium]